jgi:hypothetical protein
MIYGTFIYGERIYHECDYISVILYDFQLTFHDLDDLTQLPNMVWELYRRDDSISPDLPIDDAHILVDNGTDFDGLLRINLADYNLRNADDDFYLTAWRTDKPEAKSNTYLRYYYQDYVASDKNDPYYIGEVFVPKTGLCSGDLLTIEPSRWQMVSIPIRYGWWDSINHLHEHDDITVATIKNYIIDQIEDTYGVPAETMVEVINTYVGDVHKMWNYVCGVTIDSSEHNFPLAYMDGTNTEYCGLWIKSIHSTSFTIRWGIA